MWDILILVATIDFSTPCFEPDSVRSCVSYGASRTEGSLISRTRLWYMNELNDPIVDQRSVSPCSPISITVPWSGQPATICVTLLDGSNNESCRECILLGNWPVSVNPLLPVVIEWFDIVGRKVQPNRSGWYIQRITQNGQLKIRRVVIIK